MPVELSRIIVYPIKSLDGVSVASATFLVGGGLAWDREFALVDDDGVFLNGKRTGEINRIRAQYDFQAHSVSLAVSGFDDVSERFELRLYNPSLEEWFSDFFGLSVSLVQDRDAGFPDDTLRNGPTIVSTQTLTTVASWFPAIDTDNMRRRIRANLEFDAEAFWEDRLFGPNSEGVRLTLGAAELRGVQPCERCIVPSRDPLSGEVDRRFEAAFRERRERSLPDWVERARFDSYYKLTVNTQVAASQQGKVIRRGDALNVAR